MEAGQYGAGGGRDVHASLSDFESARRTRRPQAWRNECRARRGADTSETFAKTHGVRLVVLMMASWKLAPGIIESA